MSVLDNGDPIELLKEIYALWTVTLIEAGRARLKQILAQKREPSQISSAD